MKTAPIVVTMTMIAGAMQAARAEFIFDRDLPHRLVDSYSFFGTYEYEFTFDLGPFSADIDQHSTMPGLDSGYIASITSDISALAMSMNGSTWAGAGDRSGGHWFPMLARSAMRAEFSITEATDFEAFIDATAIGDTDIVSELVSIPSGTPVFTGLGSYSGVLMPGSYRLSVSLNSTGILYFDPDSGAEQYAASSGTIEATFTIPAPGSAMLGAMGLGIATMHRRRRG